MLYLGDFSQVTDENLDSDTLLSRMPVSTVNHKKK